MDLSFINGTVRTLDPARPLADALHVRGSRIAGFQAAGEPYDLQGGCVVPGLVDAHVHFPSWAVSRRELRLQDAGSAVDAAARAGAVGGRGWIRGRGWREELWPDRPTRELLDAATGDRPCALRSQDGHSVWINSAAGGAGDGILREEAAWAFQREHFEPTLAEKVDAIRAALPVVAARGVTGIHDFDGGRLAPEAFAALAGELTLRVHQSVPPERIADGAFVKVFMDGTLGSGTARMLGGGGMQLLSPDALAEVVRLAAAHGKPVAVHAIGDLANREALDAFAATAAIWRPLGLRHRIEHAQCVHPDDLPRFAQIGVTASVQYSHAPSDRPIAERVWADRLDRAYPFAGLLAAGAKLAGGSDAPVEELDPIAGLAAAVAEGVPAEVALESFTAVPAWLSGDEDERGRLRPGLAADLVVLDRDPLEEPASVRVKATMVAGRFVAG